MAERIGRPRSEGSRILLTAVILGAAAAVPTAVQEMAPGRFLPAMAGWAVSAAVVFWLGPAVSYRRRDALLGPWGMCIVAWRVTALPYRYWPPRDDEVSRAHYISRADFGDRWDPEYVGLWTLRSSPNRVTPSRAVRRR